MNPVLMAVVLALVLSILMLGLMGPKRRKAPGPPPEPAVQRKPCPLCGSQLGANERVHSVVFATKTGGAVGAPDKIMEISGCPHCRPPGPQKRFCPVCKKELRAADVVTARVFERKDAVGPKKTHVHVLGCPRCRT